MCQIHHRDNTVGLFSFNFARHYTMHKFQGLPKNRTNIDKEYTSHTPYVKISHVLPMIQCRLERGVVQEVTN